MKSAVEAYTWDELSRISAEIGAAGDEAAAIEVAKKYNLCTPEGKLDGTQVKSVALADGTQTTVQIVGFAHDDKTAGGKAGITFIFGDCVGEAPMNSTDTNAGGWEASQMRAYLNGDGNPAAPGSGRLSSCQSISSPTTWARPGCSICGNDNIRLPFGYFRYQSLQVPSPQVVQGRAMAFYGGLCGRSGCSGIAIRAFLRHGRGHGKQRKLPALVKTAKHQTRTLVGCVYVPGRHATGYCFRVSTNTDIHLRDPTVLAAQINGSWLLHLSPSKYPRTCTHVAREQVERASNEQRVSYRSWNHRWAGGKERIRMGFLDNVTSAVNRRTAAAGRGADKIKLNARIGELNKQRQGLAAQLGTSLYEAPAAMPRSFPGARRSTTASPASTPSGSSASGR